ncbi:unnamed protein product [Lactuca virosa]|uniref:Acyl-[acyl-carrier-protein] hydrolase n=1 Tax=Lactuca virosa TaxID=75947 RepID=A0AAU9MP09_9ASTR|nr:unnamed protein product [Lactuca virosa]
MAVMITTASILMNSSPYPGMISGKFGGTPGAMHKHENIKLKRNSSWGLQFKAPTKETSINHMKKTGFIHDGLRSEEMSKHNLTWVVAKIQMVVDRYPKWYNTHFHLYMVLGSL